MKNSRLVSFYTMSVLNPSDESDSSGAKGALAADLSAATPQLSAASMAEIIFLFRLVPGRTTESHGFRCALSAGIPEEVIERAKVLDLVALILNILSVPNKFSIAGNFCQTVSKRTNYKAGKQTGMR